MTELVSVVMPVHNAEKYIDVAIQSVIAQTYTNWELIVVTASESVVYFTNSTVYGSTCERIISKNIICHGANTYPCIWHRIAH